MSLPSNLATTPPTKPLSPPRQNVFLEWYRNMFSTRHLLSNHKHKRVINHRVQRVNSLQTGSERKSVWLPYLYPSFIALLAISLPTKYVTPVVLAIAILKRILSRLFLVFNDRYFSPDRQPGPTERERLYYYLDYWISTNP